MNTIHEMPSCEGDEIPTQFGRENYTNTIHDIPSNMSETPVKIDRILVITSVAYSRDQLLMRKDNIAHFMSVHCEISISICQQLVDLEMINIEKLKTEPIGVGVIVQTCLSNGKIIYSLFIKEKSNETATATMIVHCSDSLRTAMIEEQFV